MSTEREEQLAVNQAEINYHNAGLSEAIEERRQLLANPPKSAETTVANLQEDNAALSKEVEKLTAERDTLTATVEAWKRDARRWYGPDGVEFLDTPEEVIERRQQAAKQLAELTAKVEAMESGAAFVGERIKIKDASATDAIEDGEVFWWGKGGKDCLDLGEWCDETSCLYKGEFCYRYTGPTTAPLPTEPEAEPASPPPAKPDCLADIPAVLCHSPIGEEWWAFGSLVEHPIHGVEIPTWGQGQGIIGWDADYLTPIHWDLTDPAACRLAAEIGGGEQ